LKRSASRRKKRRRRPRRSGNRKNVKLRRQRLLLLVLKGRMRHKAMRLLQRSIKTKKLWKALRAPSLQRPLSHLPRRLKHLLPLRK
jgi:hypothetical protein